MIYCIVTRTSLTLAPLYLLPYPLTLLLTSPSLNPLYLLALTFTLLLSWACSELQLAALSSAPVPTPFAINRMFQDLTSEISRLRPSRPSNPPKAPTPTTRQDNETWQLKNTVIGEECIWRKGNRFTKEVGETICRRYLVTDGQSHWWIPQEPEVFWSKEKIKNKNCILNPTEQLYQCWNHGNPYSVLPQISRYWTSASSIQSHFWEAPQDLYWICGNKAYSKLPPRWRGSCTLGDIQPNFFLLPEDVGNHLGAALYDELTRAKRHVIGGTQKWKEEEWPPERILETYGPATWAQDGSWGYRTPIYMLNCIIRLQALIEVITNQTSFAIELFNAQQIQTRATIYQNRLALDH
uniref:Uncharacterized protein n=1 Tax=Corvus moneduloides TaxID=1196302 RepID=A0A8U7LZE8_CORMO